MIQNWIRVESGHGTGKTKLASGILSHFFDTCTPSIAYTFAPTWNQISTLLWKEIKADRRRNRLPGRVTETCEIRTLDPEHFAMGRAVLGGSNKTETVQGQHNKYLMFILDEAEGMPAYVWDSIRAMTVGGIAIVIMLGNPRTRTSEFHKLKDRSHVKSFRLSCLHHPNVLADREIISGAVRRDYVVSMLEDHATRVDEHDPDKYTFELPWQPGEIWEPDDEYLFRVLGVPSLNTADDTFFPTGRYDAARKREAPASDLIDARIGVDVARYGSDFGTVYVKHAGAIWRHAKLAQADSTTYAGKIVELAKTLYERGARKLQIRVDAGGGFGGGVVDQIKHHAELKHLYHQEYKVIEVHFDAAPYDPQAYDNCVTEMYAQSAEVIKSLAIASPPQELEGDLCERPYVWVTSRGVAVKRLAPKEQFRKAFERSPDDGDGFCLAAAPDFVFAQKIARAR